MSRNSIQTLLLMAALSQSLGCDPQDGNAGSGASGAGGMGGPGGAGGMGGAGGGASCQPENDGNPCTNDVCESDLPVHIPIAAGIPCTLGGVMCDGMGSCVECLMASDCPSPNQECQPTACNNGACYFSYAPSGTPVAAQTPNDCILLVCDGNGKTIATFDDNDTPAEDGDPCTIASCILDMPQHLPKVCQGSATCLDGECLAPVCTGTIWLSGPPVVAMTDLATSVAQGDLNGDGKSDLVVAVPSTGSVHVLFGKGNGMFLAPVAYAAGTNPRVITTADLNGDGKLDIAAASPTVSAVNVLLNQGNGTFASPVSYALGTAAAAIASADINGDGKLDLATANPSANGVSVLVNQGNGTFAPFATYGAGLGANGLAFTDLNKDGATDLVVTNPDSHNVSMLLNQGNGTFAAMTAIPFVGVSQPSSITTADFNGDGNMDYAAAGRYDDNVTVVLNLGNGAFARLGFDLGPSQHPRAVVAADVNGDAKPDLITANNNNGTANGTATVLLNQGDETFVVGETYPISPGPLSLVATDLTGDGKLDLAFSGERTVGVLLNKGDGTFLAPAYEDVGIAHSMVAAELSGDDKPDLAFAYNINSCVAIAIQQSNGSFPSFSCFPAGFGTAGLASGDINGDGKTDLVFVENENSSFGVHVNEGQGMVSFVEYPTGSMPHALAVADLNGDGKPDVAVADYHNNNHTVTVSLNQGNFSFSAPVAYPAGGLNTADMAAADFDGDGKMDLALANKDDDRVDVLLNAGGGVFSVLRQNFVGSRPNSVAAADLNGDGKIDLVSANNSSLDVSVLLNMGNGMFAPAVSYAVNATPSSVAIGDMNSDFKPDLIVTNPGSHDVRVLLNQGSGTFAISGIYFADDSPHEVIVRDLNADGRLDLAVLNDSTSRGLSILYNTCVP